MAFSMFHAPKPRKFNYTPRYFDPNQEALEKKRLLWVLIPNFPSRKNAG